MGKKPLSNFNPLLDMLTNIALTNKAVENIDLWKSLIELLKIHKVTFHKVKGHADNELNNRCDQLATAETAKFKS